MPAIIKRARIRGAKNAPRIALRRYLASEELSMEDFAARLGESRAEMSRALSNGNQSFAAFRLRMLMERAMGEVLWSVPGERTEIEAVGAALKIDILKTSLRDIRSAAWKAGLRAVPIYEGAPVGFQIYAGLLRHFFPESPTLVVGRYALSQPFNYARRS